VLIIVDQGGLGELFELGFVGIGEAFPEGGVKFEPGMNLR